MDCREFIWHCGVDPSSEELDFIRHRRECVRCAWIHRREMQFNARMQVALNLVAPEHLLARLEQIPDL